MTILHPVRRFIMTGLFVLSSAVFLFADTLENEAVNKALKGANDFPPVLRHILGVYDSRGEQEAFAYNKIQLHAASVLNHLGYVVEPIDLRTESLPSEEEMKKYGAILTWFEEPDIINPIDFLAWIEKQAVKGKKIIILGYTGMEEEAYTHEKFQPDIKARLLRLVDLEYRGFSQKLGTSIEVDYVNRDMMEFEQKFKQHPGDYEWVIPYEDRDVKTWMTIVDKRRDNSESHIVTTSPKGGYAKFGYALWEENESFAGDDPRYKWYFDPFLFFTEILGKNESPIPDPTTKNGKRLFFSHVDGDAFNSFSLIDMTQYSSDILYQFYKKEIPHIPLGISFIGAEVDPFGIKGSDEMIKDPKGRKDKSGNPLYIKGRRGNKRLLQVAKKIASLPNVQLASHTYHHPYKWKAPNLTSAFKRDPFDYVFEIKGSIDFINQYISPKGKKVEVLYWSGDTTPPEKAFALVDKMGVKNINGGDSMYDEKYNSLAHLSPFARKTGKYWQIHSCQSNENLYTNLWREDFNGMENVLEHFRRTESPRRLACANLYYHFYSGIRQPALDALKKVYQWAEKEKYEMVYPTEYIGQVEGFLSAKIYKVREGGYLILDRGDLSTVRLDVGDVDMERSRGVVSVTETNDSLYISLDPEEKYPIVQLD